MELDIAGSGISYSAGDSLAVAPANRPELVEALLQRLRLDGDRVFSVRHADEAAAADGQVRGGGAAAAVHTPCPAGNAVAAAPPHHASTLTAPCP